MNRLQRKCMVGSLALHALLLSTLLLGPAFVNRKAPPPVNLPLLKVIPDTLIDAPFMGGGNPRARATPAPPPPEPQPEPQPQPQPPEPVRTPPEAQRKPEPEPVRPPVRPEPTRPSTDRMMVQAPKTTTPTPKRPKVEISKEIVVRTNRTVAAAQSTEKPRSRDTSVRETREREQRLAALANRINQSFSGSTRSLSDNLSSSTEIDFPGPGGAAYANWRQVVMSLYYNAWILPPSTPDSQQAVVRCEVTVARNGNITAQQILQPSRVPAVNRSVEEALDRVRLRGLPPFPAESKDLYRTFRINFNLETKRELG